MAISFIGQATGTTSATLPTFTAGDLAVVWAYRDGSTTAPTLPAGWTNINSSGANTNSARIGYRILVGGDTTTGTWTNATEVLVHVYRGHGVTAQLAPNSAMTSGSSTTVSYPLLRSGTSPAAPGSSASPGTGRRTRRWRRRPA